MWDLRTRRCLRKFIGHTDGVTVAMPGPDGRVLTASEDRTVRMWDGETGECVKVVRSHSGSVTGLCMAGPDRIVTGSTDKKLRVFDKDGNCIGEAELVSEIMSVASAAIATASAASASTSAAAALQSTSSSASNKLRRPLARSSPNTVALAASAAAAARDINKQSPAAVARRVRVFACGGVHIPAPAKPMLRSVDVDATAASAAVAADSSNQSNMCTAGKDEPDGEEGVVSSVAISAAGGKGRGVLIAGSYDKGVRVLRNVMCPSSAAGGAGVANRHSIAETSDGEDEAGSSSSKSPPPSMELLGRHKDGVRSVAISACGRWAVSGSRDGRIKVSIGVRRCTTRIRCIT